VTHATVSYISTAILISVYFGWQAWIGKYFWSNEATISYCSL